VSLTDPRDAVIVAARRTPVSGMGRALSGVDVVGLAAPVLAALRADVLAASGSNDVRVAEVVLGNCCGPGGNVARSAALAAGLGVEVAASTVDRQCGSGLEAVRLAAALVDGAGVVLAGGAESASTSPWRPAVGDGFGRARFTPAPFPDPDMGPAADDLARRCAVTRQRQDAYAHLSHRRALSAVQGGVFAAEMVPVAGILADTRPRDGLTEAVLGRFRPAFAADGTVTVGNACGIDDGAAAVAVVDEATRAAWGLPGMRVVGSAVCGVDPSLPGWGAVSATRAVLSAAGLGIDDLEVVEITEAFAAQVLAATDALGLDPLGADAERVCPDGGAIALGHPWGASGALLLVRLFSRLVRRPQVSVPAPSQVERSQVAHDAPSCRGRYGLAVCAVGGGQGIALLVERVG
jgi:acetyl-CoA C-acetyltransferase